MKSEEYFAGIDVGTSYVKTAIIDDKNDIIGSFIERTGADIKSSINVAFEGAIAEAGIPRSMIRNVTATGFGKSQAPVADTVKTEISCHAKGAFHHFPGKITIIDIGGQDTKIIKVDEHGKRLGFKMNRKCAAGTGAFLEEIAARLNLSMDEMNTLAVKSDKEAALGSFCTVFAITEVITRVKAGEKVENMVRGAFESVARRVIEMDVLDGQVVMTGGVVAHNDIIADILGALIENKISIPPQPQLTGAFGAALFAREGQEPEK